MSQAAFTLSYKNKKNPKENRRNEVIIKKISLFYFSISLIHDSLAKIL